MHNEEDPRHHLREIKKQKEELKRQLDEIEKYERKIIADLKGNQTPVYNRKLHNPEIRIKDSSNNLSPTSSLRHSVSDNDLRLSQMQLSDDEDIRSPPNLGRDDSIVSEGVTKSENTPQPIDRKHHRNHSHHRHHRHQEKPSQEAKDEDVIFLKDVNTDGDIENANKPVEKKKIEEKRTVKTGFLLAKLKSKSKWKHPNPSRIHNWPLYYCSLTSGVLFLHLAKEKFSAPLPSQFSVSYAKVNAVPEILSGNLFGYPFQILQKKSVDDNNLEKKLSPRDEDVRSKSDIKIEYNPYYTGETDKGVIVRLAAQTELLLLEWVAFLENICGQTLLKPTTKEGVLFYQTQKGKWKQGLAVVSIQKAECVFEIYSKKRGGHLVLNKSAIIDPVASKRDKGIFTLRISTSDTICFLRSHREGYLADWTEALIAEAKKLEKGTLPTDIPQTDGEAIEFEGFLHDFIHQHADMSNPSLPSNNKKLFILSIDGGGVRGIMVCIILQRLCQRFPDLMKRIDFVVGCSNGGMLAMSFAFGLQPSLGRSFLELTSESIFSSPYSTIGNLMTAKYSLKWLKIVVEGTFGHKTLKEAEKKVMIPTFKMDNGLEGRKRNQKPILFHNLPSRTTSSNLKNTTTPTNDGRNGEEQKTTKVDFNSDLAIGPQLDERASDVVIRGCVAPTYFPTYQGYIDGGMYDLEPSCTGLLLAHSPKLLNRSLDDIVLLSIGTGQVQRYTETDKDHAWGISQWLPKLMNIMWDGMVMKSIDFCKDLLGERYYRIQMDLDYEITLDEPKQIPLLSRMAMSFDLEEVSAWIRLNLFPDH